MSPGVALVRPFADDPWVLEAVIMYSKLTQQYVEAMISEGDLFDPIAWHYERRRKKDQDKSSTSSIGVVSSMSPCLRARELLPFKPGPIVLSQSSKRLPPQVRLRRRLELISGLFKCYQSRRERDAIYKYLRAVYKTVLHYRLRKRTRFLAEVACKTGGISYRSDPQVFPAVIRATCNKGVDGKTVSKWSRALRYAALCQTAHADVKTFIKQHGGINGCTERFAYTRRRELRRKSRR